MEDPLPLARPGYHHGNLRAALIEAGVAALAEHDEASLSLRLLARQVSVTANAAYRHFESKDDLLSALAAEGFRRFAAAQAEAFAAHTDNPARLAAAGRAYIAFAQAHPSLFRLMFKRVTTQWANAELQEASRNALSTLLTLTAQQASGPVGDERGLVLAAAAWALVHGLSDLALGGQLAILGMDPQVLVARVMGDPMMAMPPGARAAPLSPGGPAPGGLGGEGDAAKPAG